MPKLCDQEDATRMVRIQAMLREYITPEGEEANRRAVHDWLGNAEAQTARGNNNYARFAVGHADCYLRSVGDLLPEAEAADLHNRLQHLCEQLQIGTPEG